MNKQRETQHSSLLQIVRSLYRGSDSDFRQNWEAWRQARQITTIFTPNPEQVVQAHQNPAFQTVLLSADVLLADGVGLVWAANCMESQIQGKQNKINRFSGRRILEWWLHEAQQRKVSTLLLGAKPGVGQALAQEFDPKREWCWASEAFSDITTPAENEEEEVFSLLEEKKPQVVFVAFGAPWQEMWVSKNKKELEKRGVKIMMVCGGAIDTLSPVTKISPPPAFIEKLRIEWLHRLLQQPWRWRRQLRLIYFLKLVWSES